MRIYDNKPNIHADLKNKNAFSQFYDKNWEAVFLYAVRILKSQSDAEDVVQETFGALWELRKNLSHVENLEAYLLTIAKNKSLKTIRLNTRKYLTQNSHSDHPTSNSHSPEDHYIADELSSLIDAEIANLPAKMQAVFNLSRFEQLSYKEIAEKLGISDKTVKKQINNSLKNLRLKINK